MSVGDRIVKLKHMDVKFTIKSIVSERSLNGKTKILAEANFKGSPIFEISISNGLSGNKELVRSMLLDEYQKAIEKQSNGIKKGDVI